MLALGMVRNISEAKAELSALVEEVQKGGEVILAKAGKPVAKIIPLLTAVGVQRIWSSSSRMLTFPSFMATQPFS